jgi:predicted nucleic acid-binding protein
MLIVDSGIWIDYFGRNLTAKAQQLDDLLMAGEQTIVLGDLILHEVLRGFRHDKLFEQARRLLGNLPCETLVGEQNAVAAAHHYRTLRALGHTVHKSNDVLIATWCIAEGVPLLAADRDFEPFARHLGLQLL